MSESKLDPRVLRTRKLLIDAMIQLMCTKDIKEVTTKDITDQATVNRATLYAHFQDKYELMDAALSSIVSKNIVHNISSFQALSEQTVKEILKVLITFHEEMINKLTPQCRSGYEAYDSIIHTTVKRELEQVIYQLLHKQCTYLGELELKVGSSIISSTICNAAIQKINYPEVSTQKYIAYVLPFIANTDSYA